VTVYVPAKRMRDLLNAFLKGVLPEADPHHGEEHVVLDVSKSPVREATT
jgi:hypothetical protein